jgi:hypothetical protein
MAWAYDAKVSDILKKLKDYSSILGFTGILPVGENLKWVSAQSGLVR